MLYSGGMERERTYVCIDLKSFYASVECVRRGLDPMTDTAGGGRSDALGDDHLFGGEPGHEGGGLKKPLPAL